MIPIVVENQTSYANNLVNFAAKILFKLMLHLLFSVLNDVSSINHIPDLANNVLYIFHSILTKLLYVKLLIILFV